MIRLIQRTMPNPATYLSKMSMTEIQQQGVNFSMKNEWDICYKYNYPYNVLCNFSPSSFTLDRVNINSMEGFLQCLKLSDPDVQKSVCQLPGFLAKKVGNYLRRSKQYDGTHLHWQGQPIDRNSPEYQSILNRAYGAKYAYDKEFREVLGKTTGYTLTHKIGKTSPQETVLTEQEFVDHLDALRGTKSITDLFEIIGSTIKSVMREGADAPALSRRLKEVQNTFINSRTICGENVFENDGKLIRKLRRGGVRNIVQIGALPKNRAKAQKICNNEGINYVNLSLSMENPTRFANQELVQLIAMRNSDDITYICCDSRVESNTALILNYLFNPKTNLADAVVFGIPRKKPLLSLYRTVMKHITPETEQKLGWTPEFKATLEDRIKLLQEING